MLILAILGSALFLALLLGSVSVAVQFKATVTEVLPNNTGSASTTKRTVTHDQYDESFTLNASSTAPATTCAEFLLTLTGGAASIDLRALTGTNGVSVDGNGLKLQLLRIKNLGANNMTFAEGASNGYAIGSSLVVHPNGVFQCYFADNLPDIAAADKTIDVAGTGAQTAEITIVLG